MTRHRMENEVSEFPLRETQIIWSLDNPEQSGIKPVAKLVKLGRLDDPDYFASWGACNRDFNEATDAEQVNMLFRQFAHMTIVDKVDPVELHEIFLAIPEWRAALQDFGTIEPDRD